LINRPFVALLLMAGAASLTAAHAETTLANYKPDVAKYLATADPDRRSVVTALPLIVQKNLASMHQLQSLSVDVDSYAPGKTPGTDTPDVTYHVDWQKPNDGRIQEYQAGKLVSEQVVNGTYHWRWSGMSVAAGNANASPPYVQTDTLPGWLTESQIGTYSDIASLVEPNVALILHSDDFMAVSASSVHLDPNTGLPLQSANTGQPTLIYSHYRINPVLPADTFLPQHPEQYIYNPSPAAPARPGETALNFTLPDQSGKPVSLSSLAGKPVLVCFLQPAANYNNDLTEPLEQVSHYIDAKSITTVLIAVDYSAYMKPNPAYKQIVADWAAAHPFLTKIWLSDTSKGFGDKIVAHVMTRYGILNTGAVLVDKDGKVVADYTTDRMTGTLRLLNIGKTKMDDTVLKSTQALDSALAANINALNAK